MIDLPDHQVTCRIRDFIGSGGQGEVYRVVLQGAERSQILALKWYYPEWATDQQRKALTTLTAQEPPDRRFLWPIAVATSRTVPGFGYLMPIRPDRYRPCIDLVSGRQEIGFPELVLACLELADCFLRLHARGLCYRDISFGNAFVDPGTGAVLIADNDNVAIEGRATVGIRGTDRFMAPEIVRGEALPSVKTDLYSLSVLLFYLLMVHHPLEGRRLITAGILGRDEATQLFGHQPLFVFAPGDASNAPDPDEQRNPLIYWPLYPERVRTLFTQAFTSGLHNPDARVRESVWRDCMAAIVDLIVPCACGVEVFVEPDGRQPAPCWACGSRTAPVLASLVLDPGPDQQVVMLYPGKRLFAHHLRTPRFNYRHVVGDVVDHPRLPAVRGVRNLSTAEWQAWPPDGRETTVPPGRSIAITPGTRLRLGAVDAVLHGIR